MLQGVFIRVFSNLAPSAAREPELLPFHVEETELKGEIWEEWALTYGRNGSSERKKHLEKRIER